MIITRQPLSIDELGKLAGLLQRYLVELQYEHEDGRALDEDDEDTKQREKALCTVTDCAKILREDLNYRLYNF